MNTVFDNNMNISVFDFNRAINKSLGSVLSDWKSSGIMPPKELFFKEGVNKLAIKFILENYDLEHKELLAIRNVIAHMDEELTTELKESLSETLEKKNIDPHFILENNPMSANDVVDSMSMMSVPAFKKEYCTWEFISSLLKVNPNLLDPFNKNSDKNSEFIFNVILDTDFSNIPSNDVVFHHLCKELSYLYNFESTLSNDSFAISFCNVMAGENFRLSNNVLSLPMPNSFVAKTFLNAVYRNQKIEFDKLNGTHPEPFAPNLLREMAEDPEYAQRVNSALEDRKQEFLKDQKKFGPNGLFYFNCNHYLNSQKIFNNLEKYLSPEEINSITDGASLKHIPREDVPKNVKKIQHLLFNALEHNIKTVIDSPTSNKSIWIMNEFLPNGSEDLILTPEYLNSLEKMALKNGQNVENVERQFGSGFDFKPIKRITKVLTSRPENLQYINPNLLPGALSILNNIYKERRSSINVSDILEDLSDYLNDNRALLDLERFSLNGVYQNGVLFSSFLNTIEPFDSDKLDKIKNDFFKNLLNKMGQVGVDEAHILISLGCEKDFLASHISKEDAKEIENNKNLFIEDMPYSNLPISTRKNSMKDANGSNSIEAYNILFGSETFRERVIKEKIELPFDAIKEVIENMYLSDEPEYLKIYEDFLFSYLENRPECGKLSIDEDYKDSIPRLYALFKDSYSLDNIFNEYQKSGNENVLYNAFKNISNKNDINDFLSKIKNEHPDLEGSFVTKKLISVGEAIGAGFNQKLLLEYILSSNEQKLFLNLKNFDFNEEMKLYLGDYLSNPKNIDAFMNFLGAFSRDKHSADFAMNFLKEYAPSCILSEKMNYMYENYEFNLKASDIINGVKSIVEISKKYPDIYLGQGLTLDKILCQSVVVEAGTWAKLAENLNAEEKIVLNKYGSSFAERIILTIEPDYLKENPKVNIVFKNISTDGKSYGAFNKLVVELNEIFTESFLKNNEALIRKVYFNGLEKDVLNGNVKNYLGDAGSYEDRNTKVKLQFDNQLASNSLLKKVFKESSFFELSNVYLQNEGFAKTLDDSFALLSKESIDNFFLFINKREVFKRVFSISDKDLDVFNKFSLKVLNTLSQASDEIQLDFIKKFEIVAIGKEKRQEGKSTIELFFKNFDVINMVNTLKSKHKISEVINNVNINNESYDIGDDFKL